MGEPRFLRAFGPSVARLPWASSAGAQRALDERHRRALELLDRTIHRAWLSDDPIGSFGAAIEAYAAGDVFVFYPGAVDGPPRWTISSLFDGYRGELTIRNEMPKLRAYGERAADRFANRPVSFRDLARTYGADRTEEIVDSLLRPIDLFHQLRSVLYEGSRVVLYAGLYRRERAKAFDVADHARLSVLEPTLRRWLRVAEAIGFQPLGDGALAAAVEAVGMPALLVDERDKCIVFANRAARASRHLAELPRDPRASAVPLRTKRAELSLVLLPSVPSGGADNAASALARPCWRERRDALPRYLRPVADLLHEGLSDKEISVRTQTSVATTRTYVQRILHRFDVHDRRALVRAP